MKSIAGKNGELVELDHRPTVVSSSIAFASGVVATVMSAPFAGIAIPFGLGGTLFLALGLFVYDSRRWVSLGVTNLFLTILAVGALGAAPPLILLLSSAATLISWDVGMHAITIGEQFGRQSATRRGEIVHASGSVIVGVVAAVGAYGVYQIRFTNRPVITLVLLLFGAVWLLWALRN